MPSLRTIDRRSERRCAIWIGIAWLSPFLGGLLYAIMGINRVKRRAKRLLRARSKPAIAEAASADMAPDDPLASLKFAVGRLTGLPLGSIGPALSRARQKMRDVGHSSDTPPAAGLGPRAAG